MIPYPFLCRSEVFWGIAEYVCFLMIYPAYHIFLVHSRYLMVLKYSLMKACIFFAPVHKQKSNDRSYLTI